MSDQVPGVVGATRLQGVERSWMAIVAHVGASVTAKLPWGREEALIFLNQLLAAAPDVVVQVAHLDRAGSPQDQGAQQALAASVDALVRDDPKTRRLYIDAATLGESPTSENAQRWAAAIRRLPTRVLFGSDRHNGDCDGRRRRGGNAQALAAARPRVQCHCEQYARR